MAGSTSILTLLAFNVGVELAQLAAAAVVFPSLFVLARTRAYPVIRVGAAGLAAVASVTWALDRVGAVTNPLEGIEDAAIDHPWVVVAGLAAAAVVAVAADRGRPAAMATG